jgi:hypothetical protein
VSGHLALLREPETQQFPSDAVGLDKQKDSLPQSYVGLRRTRTKDALFGMLGILVVTIVLALGIYSVARYLL